MAKKRIPQPDAVPATPLRLEWRSPAELAENPHNWRRHPEAQLSALTDVMAEVGWAGACLFNERTGRLIDGHARRKVALDQGTAQVPVLVGSWSEEEERKILATLDPLASMAEAEAAKLADLLGAVQTDSAALQEMLAGLKDQYPALSGMEGQAVDPDEAYQGLPEFVQDDIGSKFRIIVHFDSLEDVQDFGKRIGQSLTEKTRSIWHPYQEPIKGQDFIAEDTDDESC